VSRIPLRNGGEYDIRETVSGLARVATGMGEGLCPVMNEGRGLALMMMRLRSTA